LQGTKGVGALNTKEHWKALYYIPYDNKIVKAACTNKCTPQYIISM